MVFINSDRKYPKFLDQNRESTPGTTSLSRLSILSNLTPGFVRFSFRLRRPVEQQCHLHQVVPHPLDAILNADQGASTRTTGATNRRNPPGPTGRSRGTTAGSAQVPTARACIYNTRKLRLPRPDGWHGMQRRGGIRA